MGPVVVEPDLQEKSEVFLTENDSPKPRGLRKREDANLAKIRVESILDRKRLRPTAHAPEILPFQSTLAYVFHSVGGKETAIEAARLIEDTDERLKKVVYAWDQSTIRTRDTVRLEDLCAAADIAPDEFLGIVIPAIYRRNQDISKLIAAMAQPKVMEATISAAQLPHGTQDRQMLHQASGFLPTKAGQSINIDNRKQTLVAGGNSGISVEPGVSQLPSFEQDMIEGSTVLRGDAGAGSVSQLRLPAAKEEQSVQVPVLSTDSEQAEIVDAEPVE